MKKIFLIFLFLLYSCSTTIKTFCLYNKEYPKENISQAKKDLFYQVKKYNCDSINLNNWLGIKTSYNFFPATQHVFVQKTNKKTYYVFKYITFMRNDSLITCILIKCDTKSKKLIKEYSNQ